LKSSIASQKKRKKKISVYEYSFLDNTPLCMFPEFINKLSPIIEENAMILKFLENNLLDQPPSLLGSRGAPTAVQLKPVYLSFSFHIQN